MSCLILAVWAAWSVDQLNKHHLTPKPSYNSSSTATLGTRGEAILPTSWSQKSGFATVYTAGTKEYTMIQDEMATTTTTTTISITTSAQPIAEHAPTDIIDYEVQRLTQDTGIFIPLPATATVAELPTYNKTAINEKMVRILHAATGGPFLRRVVTSRRPSSTNAAESFPDVVYQMIRASSAAADDTDLNTGAGIGPRSGPLGSHDGGPAVTKPFGGRVIDLGGEVRKRRRGGKPLLVRQEMEMCGDQESIRGVWVLLGEAAQDDWEVMVKEKFDALVDKAKTQDVEEEGIEWLLDHSA